MPISFLNKEEKIWPADSNEAELRTDMVSALRASNQFPYWILQKATLKDNSTRYIVDPHVEQKLKNSIIDIDLVFRGDIHYRLGIELKSGTSDVEIEQLERHLYGLDIKQKDRWSLTKKASLDDKVIRLIVITGTAMIPNSISEIKKKTGFSEKIIWISWHEVVDFLEKLPKEEKSDPNISPLIKNLNKQGFASKNTLFPRSPVIDQYSKTLIELDKKYNIFQDEIKVLDAILQRIDYEMEQLGYGRSRTCKVTKGSRGKIERDIKIFLPKKLSRTIVDKSKIPKWIGRLYVPKSEINKMKSYKETRSLSFGIAFGYNLYNQSWTCHIEPKPKYPINEEFIKNKVFNTNERQPNLQIGGWILKGKQRNPKKVSKFLDQVWKKYSEEIIE